MREKSKKTNKKKMSAKKPFIWRSREKLGKGTGYYLIRMTRTETHSVKNMVFKLIIMTN